MIESGGSSSRHGSQMFHTPSNHASLKRQSMSTATLKTIVTLCLYFVSITSLDAMYFLPNYLVTYWLILFLKLIFKTYFETNNNIKLKHYNASLTGNCKCDVNIYYWDSLGFLKWGCIWYLSIVSVVVSSAVYRKYL